MIGAELNQIEKLAIFMLFIATPYTFRHLHVMLHL